MANTNLHGAQLRVSGPPRKPKPGPAHVTLVWCEILMSHADGNIQYRPSRVPGQPNYRAVSPNRAQSLVKAGLLAPPLLPHNTMPEGAALVAGHSDQASLVPASEGMDKAKQALQKAAASQWKPGMELPKPFRRQAGKVQVASAATEETETQPPPRRNRPEEV